MATHNSKRDEVQIQVITEGADFEQVYDCVANAFGKQVQDGIWILMNPGWDTAEGRAKNTEELRKRWHATKDSGNTIFLKATVPDPEDQNSRRIAGIAIWVNASIVPGHGQIPESPDLEALYPGNEKEQRYLTQAVASLHRKRLETLAEKAKPDSKQKSMFVLDLCVTDPAFQRRGIAKKLVQWGVDEAKVRGDLELTTEGSAMGRHVYKLFGFQEVDDIKYEVDKEFKGRSMPANVFMRTRPS